MYNNCKLQLVAKDFNYSVSRLGFRLLLITQYTHVLQNLY